MRSSWPWLAGLGAEVGDVGIRGGLGAWTRRVVGSAAGIRTPRSLPVVPVEVSDESSAVRWRLGIDPISGSMDRNMVVVPAQCGEVVDVVCTAVRVTDDVVWLQAVP